MSVFTQAFIILSCYANYCSKGKRTTIYQTYKPKYGKQEIKWEEAMIDNDNETVV